MAAAPSARCSGCSAPTDCRYSHHRRQRAAVVLAMPLARGPPSDYDHRALQQQSAELVGRRHPELLPLVAQGTLVALERPADYTERREDGYQEPLQIYLVGTAHVSQQSAEDVRQVVRAVRPDAVVVELCRSRQAAMYPTQQRQHQQDHRDPEQGRQQQPASAALLSAGAGGSGSEEDEADEERRASPATASSNPLSLSGPGLLPAFQRTIQLGGSTALILRLLLARLSARMAGGLGAAPGLEFVAAREEAEALEAQLVLGDRPIEITLQRAWAALSWPRRVQLASELAAGAVSVDQAPLDAAAVEALKDDDTVSLLFNELGTRYPELLASLIHERDLYIAWSLKRSKAVNGAHAVVGVVGKGHLRGVVYALTHDAAGANLRFSDLVGGKNLRQGRRREALQVVKRVLLETAAFGVLWYAWTMVQPQ